MENYITRLAKETANRPTAYEFQKTAVERGLITTKKELQQFQRIKAGEMGENKFNEWLKHFGKNHWVSIRNAWFNDFADFECDSLLLTRHCLYHFEIKHYYGKFVYENGACSSRGVPITYNPINQARNTTLHLKNIMASFSKTIPVKGVLVFIGEHSQVDIKDDINYIDILECNEVYQYIQDIIEEESRSPHILNTQKVAAHLEKHEIVNPYQLLPYSREEMKKVKKGAFCNSCTRSLKLTRANYFECSCGYCESRECTIIRTACEYGVLTFGTPFTIQDIRGFLGNEISINHLRKTLNKHFTQVVGAKVTTYYNLGRLQSHLSSVFTFDLPNIMKHFP